MNILQFADTIYGETITVQFLQFLRADKKFESSTALITAMEGDKQKAEAIISTLTD